MIIILHQTVTTHDAIGTDIEYMFNLLEIEHSCFVYAENRLNPKIKYIEKENLLKEILNYDNIIIYHHSVFWEEGYNILKKARCKIYIKYHNITPPQYFKPYHEFAYQQCLKGRRQTLELIHDIKDAFWISDSEYNSKDIICVDDNNKAVVAPFHNTEKLITNKPDEKTLKNLIEQKEINLLFVSRIAPNKGHLALLDVVKIYNDNYERKVKLNIIGKFDDNLSGYNKLIKRKIYSYGIRRYVNIVGEINDSILSSYYLGCDFYINMSEHEGFCVPIIEAQLLGLPIIALNACAIPETIGEGQVILDNNPKKFAAAIHLIFNNDKWKKMLINNGFKNVKERFLNEIIRKNFINTLKKGMER